MIIPPEEIISFVDSYRRRFAKYTSYIIPPHFTIYPPFYCELSEDKLIKQLSGAFSKVKSEKISMKTVSFFEGKNNVAFFSPTQESSKFIVHLLSMATNCLLNKVKNVYDDYNFTPEKFNPHMTIAEKVPPEIFPSVKDELNKINFNYSFDVDAVYLYKQSSNSTVWSKMAKIKLSLF